MFREFNVKFEDVEMLGGADNLLEGTEITKVIVRGDNNKMSSLDSMLKNCNELDTVEGELDLNGVSDIDNLLEGTELVKSINLKNINNENISANNSFPNIDRINIGGELYNKKAMQNVIASKEWTFDNINYQGTVSDNIVTKEVNVIDDNKVTIQDTLEQKAKGIEIIGQTYENLVEGKGEYKLTDNFSTTWTESNDSIENPPSMIEIPEIWGNTVQGLANLVTAKQIVDSINNATWNEGFKDVSATLNPTYNTRFTMSREQIGGNLSSSNESWIKLKPNTTYSCGVYTHHWKLSFMSSIFTPEGGKLSADNGYFTTGASGNVLFVPDSYSKFPIEIFVAEGKHNLAHGLSENELREIFDLKNIQSVGDLYVDESGEPILDEEGNEQYKLEIKSHSRNLWDGKTYHKGRKQNNKKWGAIDSQFTDNWSLKEPYGVQYDITASSMRGPTIPIECLEAGKYINLTFKVTMPQYVPNITVHFFDNNKVYIGNIFNRWDGGFSGNMVSGSSYTNLEGVYLGGLIPDGATCCEIVFALSQKTDDVPYPQHIEITDIMVTVDDNVITSYRDCEPQKSNKTTILMPQPLRSIKTVFSGYVHDKLYWDSKNNKYFIEKVVDKQIVNINKLKYANDGHTFITASEKTNLFKLSIDVNNIPSDFIKIDLTNNIRSNVICDKAKGYDGYEIHWNKDEICCSYDYSTRNTSGKVQLISWRLPKEYDSVEKSIDYLKSLGDITFYVMAVPQIIETKILEKPSLEAYSPKTYITTNTEIQPSQMTVTNKRNLIDLKKMKANTDYTLQLKCNKKGNKPIKINLCGKEKDVDATIGVNHVNITTNELNDNRLELSGEGNIVSEIIVVEGEMNQYPEYFNGVQNTGELQDDGTYKIDVSTNNGGFKNLFDINNFFVNSNNRGELIISSEDNSITSNYTDWFYTVETNIDLKAGKEYLIKLDFECATTHTGKYALIMLGDKGYNLDLSNHADFEIVIEHRPYTEQDLKASFNIVYTPSSDKTIYFGLSHGMRMGGSIKIKNIEIAEYNDNLNMDIPLKSHNVAITSNSPLAKGDKLYWSKSNKRYEIDRSGSIEVPTVSGDIIDLPRLYQREDTHFSTSTGNIKPSKIKIDYNDLD